jgi:chromosomal replication initiation ATPase DnaA
MKVVHRKNPTYSYMSAEQQSQVKYQEMEYIVKRARADLEQLSGSLNTIKVNADADMDRIMFNNVRTQKRKLLMKEVILEELRYKVKQ